MSDPQVSVVLPTYNRPWGLRRAAESVLSQTNPDFELIIMDDCSTDVTEDVAREFSDPRVRYVRQPRNVGIARNWGDGLRNARAPYVCFLMDDDYYDSTFLENRLNLVRENPGTNLVFSGYKKVSREGQLVGESQPPYTHGQRFNHDALLEAFFIHGGVFIGAMVCRTDRVRQFWDRAERSDLIVDYALCLNLAMEANPVAAIFCAALDFNMCVHEEQVFHKRNSLVWPAVTQALREVRDRATPHQRHLLDHHRVSLLTEQANLLARSNRSAALKALGRSVWLAPFRFDLWRRRAYVLSLIMGGR